MELLACFAGGVIGGVVVWCLSSLMRHESSQPQPVQPQPIIVMAPPAPEAQHKKTILRFDPIAVELNACPVWERRRQ